MKKYKVRVSERIKRLNPPLTINEIMHAVFFFPDSAEEDEAIHKKLESMDNLIDQKWYIQRLISQGKAQLIEPELDASERFQ